MKLCSKGCGRETPSEKHSYCRECQREYAKRRYMESRPAVRCSECGTEVVGRKRSRWGVLCQACTDKKVQSGVWDYQRTYRETHREELRKKRKAAYWKLVEECSPGAREAGMPVGKYIQQLREARRIRERQAAKVIEFLEATGQVASDDPLEQRNNQFKYDYYQKHGVAWKDRLRKASRRGARV